MKRHRSNTRRIRKVGEFALAALLFFWVGMTLAQSDLCRDLDGDGHLAGAGCALQEDCNDLNATIHPLAPELCNGFDDDCDGDLDEGCTRTCADFELHNRVMVDVSATKGRIATADRSWAIMFSDSANFFPYYVTRFDFNGQQLAPKRLYSGGEDVPEFGTDNNILIWDGSRMAIAWHVYDLPVGAYFREVGPWGVSENRSLLLTTSGAGGFGVWSLIWNGYEYGMFYARGVGGNYRINRITAASEDLGENVLFSGGSADFAWNGSGYGVLLRETSSTTNFSELYFRKVTPEGFMDGQEIQLTDHTGLPNEPLGVSFRLKLVHIGPGQGYGITWSDYKTGRWNVFFARLDEDGNLMTPPGEVQISDNVGVFSDIKRDQDLIWNGEEFLLAWSLISTVGEIHVARISREGTILEKKIVIDNGTDFATPRLAWNGKEYGLIFGQQEEFPLGTPDVELATIGCNCATDGDSDGVLPCMGGDCDDSDPEVGAGMNEICADRKDNDCDGLIDCNDPDCGQGGKPSGEISDVGFDDKVTLFWAADSKADDYDIARGDLSDLRQMENYRWSECFGSRISGTVVTDTEIPAIGAGWYYQVRGHARTCLVGPWGDALKEDTIRSCP